MERNNKIMYYTSSNFNSYFKSKELELALESKLTAAEKRALPDEAFGLPEERKYPLIVKDESGNYEWTHLKDAIAYFNTCKDENKKKILAGNIARVIKEYNVDIEIKPNNKIRNYANFD